MKAHRPWQPHLDRDPLFNPFIPTTVRPVVDDHVELAPEEGEEEGEEQQQTSERVPGPTDANKE